MGTTWIPLTRFEPRTWLLANGETVQEPALEQTGTGRKVRVAGQQATSVYNYEIDDLLVRAVRQLADAKQTTVLIEETGHRDREVHALGFDPPATKALLHLIHDPTDAKAKTTGWWRFKAPKMPFEVVLYARLTPPPYGSNSQQVQVVVGLTQPILNGTATESMTFSSDTFPEVSQVARRTGSDAEYAWREFIRDNPPNWITSMLGNHIHPHPRAAVTSLLEVVREFESYESLQVPDMSDPASPAWMELELYETNVNAEFVSELTEYLDGAPTIEQAADLYDQMLATLRSAGIAVSAKSRNDFLAALLAGEKSTLNMEVANLNNEDGEYDHHHTLSVHLPTGTFIVECNHAALDTNTVAEHWEEAKTIAALTGEESELLAYARGYAQEKIKKRTANILKERGARTRRK